MFTSTQILAMVLALHVQLDYCRSFFLILLVFFFVLVFVIFIIVCYFVFCKFFLWCFLCRCWNSFLFFFHGVGVCAIAMDNNIIHLFF